jgi:hypothetical protein
MLVCVNRQHSEAFNGFTHCRAPPMPQPSDSLWLVVCCSEASRHRLAGPPVRFLERLSWNDAMLGLTLSIAGREQRCGLFGFRPVI